MDLREIMGPPLDPERHLGVINYFGIPVAIEHRAGDQNPWSHRKTKASYGEIPGTLNIDGDAVDVLLGDDLMSQRVFVLQQRVPPGQNEHDRTSDADGGPPMYDEDKVVLGVGTETEARELFEDYYHGSGREIGGVLVLTVDELREKLADPFESGLPIAKGMEGTDPEQEAALGDNADLLRKAQVLMELGYPRRQAVAVALDLHQRGALAKSLWLDGLIVARTPDRVLSKAATPPGSGWQPIPDGKHGGWRKPRAGKKGWDYFYPDQHEIHHHPDWTEDWGAGVGVVGLSPGSFVKVTGQHGLWRYTPEHGGAPGEGKAWLTSAVTGEHKAIATDKIIRVKGHNPAAERAAAKPKPKPKPKPPGGPALPPPAAKPPPGPVDHRQLDASAERVPVFEGSHAKKGTIEHKLENGAYLLRQYQDAGSKAWHTGAWIPPEDHAAFLGEFNGLVHAAALRVAKQHRIPAKRNGEITPEYEELVQASRVGLLMAVRQYQGKGPFGRDVVSYTRAYAAQAAASELGKGVPMPSFMARMVPGFLAAKAQAEQAHGELANADQIARHWTVTKRQVFQGDLGKYAGEGDTEIAQGNQQVPLVSWRVKDPTGREVGKEYPGRIALAEELLSFVAPERAQDIGYDERPSSALQQAGRETILPRYSALTMPMGTALAVREEVNFVLADLPAVHRQVLTLHWGLDGGEPMSKVEVAEALGLSPEKKGKNQQNADPKRQLSYLGQKAIEAATDAFKKKAKEHNLDVGGMAAKWSQPNAQVSEPIRAIEGPSQSEIHERFGKDQLRTSIYIAALHEGKGAEIGKVLDAETKGEASEADVQRVRSWYMDVRDKQRVQQFHQQTRMVGIDPAQVRDIDRGTDPEKLPYTDEVLRGYMIAIAKHGLPTAGSGGATAASGRSRIWSDERLRRFLGQPRPDPDQPAKEA